MPRLFSYYSWKIGNILSFINKGFEWDKKEEFVIILTALFWSLLNKVLYNNVNVGAPMYYIVVLECVLEYTLWAYS